MTELSETFKRLENDPQGGSQHLIELLESFLLPFLLVLSGIVGGMQSFGLVGLFLGPVIMAALLTVWREWIGIRE